MSYSTTLHEVAHYLEQTEQEIDRVKFCFNVYLEFARDGQEPTSDMDATKARIQLDNAIAALLRYPGSMWG